MTDDIKAIRDAPLVHALARWEDNNGAMACILPSEWDALKQEVMDACVEQSPRMLRAQIARLLDALEQAQRDAERLDWLDENPDKLRRSTGYLGSASTWSVRDDDGIAHDFMSARAAIDAAMKGNA